MYDKKTLIQKINTKSRWISLIWLKTKSLMCRKGIFLIEKVDNFNEDEISH